MRTTKLITGSLIALAGAAMLVVQSARAADTGDAAARGSVRGTIVNAKGAPAAGCIIKIFAPISLDDKAPSGGGGKGAAVDINAADHVILLQARGTPVGNAKTDDKGNFEIRSIKVGTYRYLAGNRTLGLAGGSITIEANKTAELQVTLKEPGAR